jgi:hypothetical protein
MTGSSEGASEGIAADPTALRRDVTRLSESIRALIQSVR